MPYAGPYPTIPGRTRVTVRPPHTDAPSQTATARYEPLLPSPCAPASEMPEHDEPCDRERDAEALETRQRDPAVAGDHDGQDPDAAGSRRLNQRKGREGQREHVQQPADRLDAEAREPAALAEQEACRAQGVQRRERRQPRRDAVLDQVADVQRTRRDQRDH